MLLIGPVKEDDSSSGGLNHRVIIIFMKLASFCDKVYLSFWIHSEQRFNLPPSVNIVHQALCFLNAKIMESHGLALTPMNYTPLRIADTGRRA